MQSELVVLLQGLRIPQPAPFRDNPSYRPNYTNANVRDQNGRPSVYRGIYCHNCREEGHYSTSCTRPVVSWAQREVNRRAIDELQRGYLQYPRGPGPALGSPSVPVFPAAAVASGGVEGQEQGGRAIARANVVILKRPMIEEADDDSEIYTYPVTAATRSQKRNLEAKKFHPTSRVTKLAGRNLERSLAHQESRN